MPRAWRPWWDALLHQEPGATTVAVGGLAVMILGAVLTIRTGRWYARLLLVAGAAVWPLPDHVLLGPVLFGVAPRHGIHLSDLLTVAALLIALVPWRRLLGGRPRRERVAAGPTNVSSGRHRA